MKIQSALAPLAQVSHPNRKKSPKMNFVGLRNILKPPAKSMFSPDCSQEPMGNAPMLDNCKTIKLCSGDPHSDPGPCGASVGP